MSGSKREWFLVCLCFLTLGGQFSTMSAKARQDDGAVVDLALDAEDPNPFVPPPGDPWYVPPQQARGPRAGAGDALVSKARITPHWFHQNNRFWYRNDLGAGKREFILVDTESGTRKPAFDHQKLAAALTKASGAAGISAEKLPFDAIEFAADLKSIRFRVGETTWRCDLSSFDCARSEGPLSISSTTEAQTPANPGRNRADRRDSGASDRSPDKKWTAVIKDHNVFVRREGETAEIKLSQDGSDGHSYGHVGWSPDSEDARCVPHRARRDEGGLPDPVLAPGGRPRAAALATLPAARRQVHGLRAQPLRYRLQEIDQAESRQRRF